MTEPFSSLPSVDFAEFGDGSSEGAHAVGRRLFEAFRDVGFVYLTNTGIPQEKVDGMFGWVSLGTTHP
jgi:isopenicillin N synthase-like dioxygenase